jgi:hypothetical protein
MAVFDDDAELHDHIKAIFASMMRPPPAPVGPSRDELLAHLAGTAPHAGG